MMLGIDGGGSRIRVVSFRGGNPVASLNYEEPGNFLFLGPAGLSRLINRILSDFGVTDLSSLRVVVGLAGSEAPSIPPMIHSVFVERGFAPDHVVAMSDSDLGMKALQDAGVLVVAGTGGVCVGKYGSVSARAGGWGYLIDGCAGSAFHLGMLAFRHVCRVQDGVQEVSSEEAAAVDELAGEMINFFSRVVGFRSRNLLEVVPFLYEPPVDKSRMAALAPIISNLAVSGNRVASACVHEVVRAIADHVRAVVKKLNPPVPVPLGLWGGLFTHPAAEELFIKPLLDKLDEDLMRGFLVPVRLYHGMGDEDVLVRAVRSVFAGD